MPSGQVAVAQPGDTLLQAAEKAGILLNAACAGTGICGNCKVRIVSGSVDEPSKAEEDGLSAEDLAAGYRLACLVQPAEDLLVEIPALHGSSQRKKDMIQMPDNFLPQIKVRKLHCKVPRATMKYQKNDLSRILQTIGCENLKIARDLLPQIHTRLEEKKGDVTLVTRGDLLFGLEPGDSEAASYGAAFDIGTTTIVGMLWDLNSGQLMDVAARTNPQSLFGADVISRIHFCAQEADNLSLMQQKVIGCINDILLDFSARLGIPTQSVYDLTVAGNTTMSHLFAGVDPAPLARTPFAPVFCQPLDTPAGDLGIQANKLANVYLLPNIAGHVGSDIVAVMLALGIDSLSGITIAIDIGTNGEVVLAKDGSLSACSTAAGPAFEGAAICHGMRASAGAIEEVIIEGAGVAIKVIDDADPVGICGSGLIDAVAQLLKNRLIDSSGRLLERQEAERLGIHPDLCRRLVLRDEMTAFVLAEQANGQPVILTQQDIREVQLAKGAILAGIRTLLQRLNVSEAEVDRIIIAGAFGNFIKKESAMTIGLLPLVSLDKITFCGNAAGTGVAMALLSDNVRRHGEMLAERTEHLELSMNPDFQEEFVLAMSFPAVLSSPLR